MAKRSRANRTEKATYQNIRNANKFIDVVHHGDGHYYLIQYMKHESKIWDAAHASSDFYKLMGYHPETLQSFIHKKRDWFI